MPKIKTRKSVAKRLKKVGPNKIRRGHACTSHNLTKKNTGRKRKYRKAGFISPADLAKVKAMMGG